MKQKPGKLHVTVPDKKDISNSDFSFDDILFDDDSREFRDILFADEEEDEYWIDDLVSEGGESDENEVPNAKKMGLRLSEDSEHPQPLDIVADLLLLQERNKVN